MFDLRSGCPISIDGPVEVGGFVTSSGPARLRGSSLGGGAATSLMARSLKAPPSKAPASSRTPSSEASLWEAPEPEAPRPRPLGLRPARAASSGAASAVSGGLSRAVGDAVEVALAELAGSDPSGTLALVSEIAQATAQLQGLMIHAQVHLARLRPPPVGDAEDPARRPHSEFAAEPTSCS